MAWLSHLRQNPEKQMYLKNRLITQKTEKLLPQKGPSKVNLIIKFTLLVALFAYASPAHASFFSAISDWLNKSASASTSEEETSSQGAPLLEAPINPNPATATSPDTLPVVDGHALLSEAGVSGTISDVIDHPSSDQISIYVVRKGDTLASIAKMFDVSVNTIKWANDVSGTPKEGDTLTILPVTGIKYTVKKGDTVESIAKKYKSDATEIKQFNDVAADGVLNVGDIIIIPDAELDVPAPVKKVTIKGTSKIIPGSSGPNYSGYYVRPIVGGRKTQGLHGHNGVDLAGVPIGSSVLAAADGVVIISKMGGYNGGYGNYIVVAHPNGTQTLYGHLNSISVARGDKVTQGQKIGGMGNSGRSTGPHLHFEVRGAVNPF